MIPTLPAETRRELAELADAYGHPLVRSIDLAPNSYLTPENLGVGAGEVCMVVRRSNGQLLTFRKTFYPPGVFRLLTGGIASGERMLDAVRRESHEETGLETEVRRLLAVVAYGPERGDSPSIFHTVAFLLDEVGGTLGALDEREHVEAFRDIELPELLAIADQLDHLDLGYAKELHSRWCDWGRFRAVIHRVVWDALQSPV
ncbi:MAG: NUDIX hydrolase [Armatimonadota bacterium]